MGTTIFFSTVKFRKFLKKHFSHTYSTQRTVFSTVSSWLRRVHRSDNTSILESSPNKDGTSFRIFSDPQLHWMQLYSVISEDMMSRWSLTMMIIDSRGIIRDMQRDIDPRQLQRHITEGMARIER